jgi:hypothetical protein
LHQGIEQSWGFSFGWRNQMILQQYQAQLMKKILFLFLLALVALSGCKSSYDVTLSNGRIVSGVTKPVLDKVTDQYRFNLPNGKEVKVPAARVRIIEPHDESSASKFVVPTQK